MSPGLDWVLRCLWGTGGPVRVSTSGRVPAGCRGAQSFAVLPSAAHPRLLVPLESRRAGSAALRQYRSGKRLLRLVTPPLSLALRAGAGAVLLRDRVQVSLEERDPPVAPGDVLLSEHLREIFGGRDLQIAVVFDTPRPHRKPTVHILAPDGKPLGFAKIGWNDLTRRLVRAEADVLEKLGRRPEPREFSVPALLHVGSWRELEVMVVAPIFDRAPHRAHRLLTEPPVAATMEVARLSGTTRARLIDSAYWEGVRARIAATEAALGPAARGDLRAAAGELERRDGEAGLAFGFWHGDWVPWNMAYHRGRLRVWDWERSGEAAPIGLDAVHFDFQAEVGLRRTPPRRAVLRTLDRSPGLLASLGLDERLGPVLLSLHLLEMALRFDEARAAGVKTADQKYLDALTNVLLADR